MPPSIHAPAGPSTRTMNVLLVRRLCVDVLIECKLCCALVVSRTKCWTLHELTGCNQSMRWQMCECGCAHFFNAYICANTFQQGDCTQACFEMYPPMAACKIYAAAAEGEVHMWRDGDSLDTHVIPRAHRVPEGFRGDVFVKDLIQYTPCEMQASSVHTRAIGAMYQLRWTLAGA